MEMASDDVIITVRMLMAGKEIGGIIGKGGANISGFREQSGAKITISTAQNCPERIVTITGGQSQIHSALKLMTEKMQKDVNSGQQNEAANSVPVTIRLIVPASQCGSIIGKGGAKIKEIRDTSACSIQVQSEMLPNSSERTVTLSGVPSTIVHCIDMLCEIMVQYPAKTATVPYQPQGNGPPMIMHKTPPFMMQNQFPMESGRGMFHGGSRGNGNAFARDQFSDVGMGLGDGMSLLSQDEPVVTNFPAKMLSVSEQELTVPNDMVGCIIGKGGARINEIRQLSGATIKINKTTEDEVVSERKIEIQGPAESICLAQYLINLSVQVYGTQDKTESSAMDASSNNGKSQGPHAGIRSLLGVPPRGGNMFNPGFGGGPGNFRASLMSARHSFLSNIGRGGFNKSSYKRSSEMEDEPDFTADVTDLASSGMSGDGRKKMKREKFQPY